MSRRILEVPVIGRILRTIASVIYAPRRFDDLFRAARETDERLSALQEHAQQQCDRLEQQEQVDFERLGQKIDRLEGEEIPQRISRLESSQANLTQQVMTELLTDGDFLQKLNLGLSIHPTLWGPAERLQISPLASVFTCFFNTNSGTIRIGDYTFAGSGVSILAGSHDARLKGFLRRDAEMRDECDIRIGSGVWLASGCIVLGPCQIDDHAVIAAGAVVTPGTHVPAGTMYGGVPAKKICDLQMVEADEMNHPAILQALKRHDGALFVSGWSPKSMGLSVPGHWLTGNGVVLVSAQTWRLMYQLKGGDHCELTVSGPEGESCIPLEKAAGEKTIVLPCASRQVAEIRFEVREEGLSLLMALLPCRAVTDEIPDTDDRKAEEAEGV